MAGAVDHTLSKQLPAHSTFAHSREDVLNAVGFYFGDPAVPEKLRDYSEHRELPPASTLLLPLLTLACAAQTP